MPFKGPPPVASFSRSFSTAWPCACRKTLTLPPDALLRLQWTSCFGPCPIYTVTIDSPRDGHVRRRSVPSESLVRRTPHTWIQVHRSGVAGEGRKSIRFFEMRDAYRVIENPDGTVTSVTDLPTKFVSVTVNGRTKKVEDYIAAPDSLAEFERDIDTAAGTKRWVFLDEDALEELDAFWLVGIWRGRRDPAAAGDWARRRSDRAEID